MPIPSDYHCEDCNKIFEYNKYYGEENFPEHPECPTCKGTNTRRKFAFSKVIPDYMKSINN